MSLNIKHRKLIANIVAGMNRIDAYMVVYKCKNRDTAAKNVSRLMLNNAELSETLDAELDDIVKQASDFMKGKTFEAAECLETMMKYGTKDAETRRRAAVDILTFGGVKPPDKVEVSGELDIITEIWRECARPKTDPDEEDEE